MIENAVMTVFFCFGRVDGDGKREVLNMTEEGYSTPIAQTNIK